LVVGIAGFSNRSACNFSLEQIKELVNNKKDTKIYLMINKNFFDPELPGLEKLLIDVCKLDIDGIMFADYAVPQILFENKINTYLIYNPETLNVNRGKIDWFVDNNINEICLAREINKREMFDISNNKKTIKTQVQGCGYAFMMDSR
jgi:collagenase-like PrtC family protease